jgi:phenylalanyl-tRNA synthetase beta chain
MKISFNWLKQYIDFNESIEEVSTILTDTGLEVEGIEKVEQVKGGLKGLVIGKVLTCKQHPNADKLKITTVDIGNGMATPIVCGAPNVAAGQTVIVAPVGTTLYPITGDEFKIKKAKIRGEVSEGMICAEDEIGVGASHDGIMVLETTEPIGSPAVNYFQFTDDYTIEIGLTPNRADATSHIGVARDLKAIFKKEVIWPSVKGFKADNNDLNIAVTVENTVACPRYSGVTLTGLTIAESPDWLKQRLQAIGLSPINNIVDVTNFVLHETGQPLHAFDADKIKGQMVVVKTLPSGSKFKTLDAEERSLTADDLMICNESEGMCIAGVLGGIHSGVTDATKNIFLESAYFSADYIRKTALQHQIKTDASFRFERGTDPNKTVYALKRAAILIKELAGGRISSEIVDVYPETIADFQVPVKYAHIDRLLGKKLPKEVIKEILINLDIHIEQENNEGFLALVPPYRVDVQREADVIEEILRIYGFENIELPEMVGATYLAEFNQTDSTTRQKKITGYLVGNGFYELMTNSLTKPDYVEWTSSLDANNNVEILNKLSEDLGVLRQSLLFSGLEIVAHNINRRQKNLKLFEFGKTYTQEEKTYRERSHLGIFMTGRFEKENWASKHESTVYHHISGIVDALLDQLNINKIGQSRIDNDLFAYGLTYMSNEKPIGEIGLVQPAILKKFGIKQEVFYADLDWDLLFSQTIDNIVVERPSRFPEVRRDLSLVIDKKVQFKDILAVVRKTERKLIKDLDIFDVYEGDKVDENKKAYSLKFILEDKEKTLTDKLIDKTMKRLMNAFERELGALIRQ